MKLSILLRLTLASFLSSTSLIDWKIRKGCIYNPSKPSFLILMYHRIIQKEEEKKGIQEGMYVKQDTFEKHIRFLKKYFRIITLAECPIFDRKVARLDDRPFCIITFDDGWYDFYHYAFPVLRTYQVPATVFLPTDYIGTEKWFWTDRLAYLFYQKDNLTDSSDSLSREKYLTGSIIQQIMELKGPYNSRLEKAIALLKGYPIDEIENTLLKLSTMWHRDLQIPDRAFMSWEEIKEMAQSGLIHYGSHTVNHKILTTLKDQEVQDELVKSKERLIMERVVDPSFIPFCYPNGDYDERIAQMVKKQGYSLAVTTKKKWNNTDSDPFTLARIGIHQDMAITPAMFGCRISNIF